MLPTSHIFDRALVRRRRDRAAAGFADHEFLLAQMAERLSDRLPDFKRTFPFALDLGAHHGLLSRTLGKRGGVKMLVQTDMSVALLGAAQGLRAAADEEFLPFADDTFDLVMSAGSLHWVNDLPGAFIQIKNALKRDGLFLAMLPGGQTLKELRQSLEQAELQLTGGVSPRVSPFIEVRDAGALLQRTGFGLPVADSEVLTIYYEDPLDLLYDLRGMGETNALLARSRKGAARRLISAAMGYYQQRFTDEQGRIPATFELVTITGWKA